MCARSTAHPWLPMKENAPQAGERQKLKEKGRAISEWKRHRERSARSLDVQSASGGSFDRHRRTLKRERSRLMKGEGRVVEVETVMRQEDQGTRSTRTGQVAIVPRAAVEESRGSQREREKMKLERERGREEEAGGTQRTWQSSARHA
ncbi:hypothetical protein FKP32DRAFT_1600323 [Trametes sanguinea]|nr:hypothetical protein FKP32DRAFT_1600323 [Trametes sanguinea]